ncbi:MAG: NAD(P) transhydrogenase subunit alpha [Acidimicrobiaceae bacterium]|nr:NAD(P) transhydrogenase subunit alpha [Acidimicrobiaceae bacterium]
MRLRLLRETAPRENRVALVPDGVDVLVQRGCDVIVERSAGTGSGFGDDAYRSVGAAIVDQFAPGADVADVVVSVRDAPLGSSSLNPAAVPATVFVGVFDPLWAPNRAQRHAGNGVSAFSLDLVPRVTRAQSMDVLSSMATIAGYEAVLLAASRLPQMFPLMMTAAGTLAPARVLVLGAGVAGLQAIGTARRLGGVVDAYDVRPEAVEQIRSIGARALDLEVSPTAVGSSAVTSINGYAVAQSDDVARIQREMLAPHVAGADVVITAASVPGRPSPLLVTAEMVDGMDAGSVLVDLAAERGGNCEVTKADETVERNGATVLGPTDLVSKCARHASQMFSRNLVAFLEHLAPDGEVEMRSDDEILSAMLVTHDGAVVHPGVAAALEEA